MFFCFAIIVALIQFTARSQSHASHQILSSDNLHLFSDGILQYFIEPDTEIWGSILKGIAGCLGHRPDQSNIKIQINLSDNLQIKRTSDKSLQIIDIITNKPLPNLPGDFDSKEQLNEWIEQLQEITQYSASYTTYIGIALKQKICLSLSGSRIFCGNVVFIGNIPTYDDTYFAIQISEKEMKSKQVSQYIDSTMITDGSFDHIQYFNYMNNTDDTFIILNITQIFFYHQYIGVDPITKQTTILPEMKDFFILAMPEIWHRIELELNAQYISIPGVNDMIYIDSINLSELDVRSFDYEPGRSLSSSLFYAALKVFGDVNIVLYLTSHDGRKYTKSTLTITKMYVEGAVEINYQLAKGQPSKQQLNIGFIRKPSVEFLQYSNMPQFPRHIITESIGMDSHIIDWLESIVETLLETRDTKNMFVCDIDSPYDE
eukprot:446598_1